MWNATPFQPNTIPGAEYAATPFQPNMVAGQSNPLPEGFGTVDYFSDGAAIVRTVGGVTSAPVGITASTAYSPLTERLVITLAEETSPAPVAGATVRVSTAAGAVFAGSINSISNLGSIKVTVHSWVQMSPENSV